MEGARNNLDTRALIKPQFTTFHLNLKKKEAVSLKKKQTLRILNEF